MVVTNGDTQTMEGLIPGKSCGFLLVLNKCLSFRLFRIYHTRCFTGFPGLRAKTALGEVVAPCY